MMIISFSCSKEEVKPEKVYTVKYELKATPLANTNLTGNISYNSKNSASEIGVLTNSGWTVTETSWKLKAGDKIGFTASISNLATYEASITVDGGVRVYEKGGTTLAMTTPFNLTYVIQ